MTEFPAYVVRARPDGPRGAVERMTSVQDWPGGDGPAVTIDVEWSSLNYKDALACRGHKGVAPRLPHVPGIDCAGSVCESSCEDFAVGDAVLVTGYELGAPQWGGLSARVRVPADWVVKRPTELDARQAMVMGTAGFTAAQCVMAITNRVDPAAGDVVVTGSTGGVGSVAVALLARLGYRVVAVTGKPALEGALREMGAAEVAGRDAVTSDDDAPLLAERWGAAVDTVGGGTLATIVRQTRHRGVVAACGLVGGDQLPLSVYPFLLRGVWLAGIDSAKCPRPQRLEVWRRLAGAWRVALPEKMVTETTLDGVAEHAERLLAGSGIGRTIVRPHAAS
ncbi:MAG: YhdH/YhfP family quinone oxidoreductase [Lacipirellulaceae bacterium]